MTVDVYQIDIDDRIVLTGGFTSDDPDIGPILIAQELAEARFFTNAIDTRTQGVDLTVAHRRPMLGGNLTTSLALNYNQTEVQRINTAPSLAGKEDIYFNQRERLFVEGSAPELKSVLGAGLRRGDWRGGLALAYFGEVVAGTWSQVDDPAAPPQIYKPRLTTDLHVGYDVTPAITFTVGVVNLFDVVPTYQDPDETENGARWENVQMGFNGTAYFARFGYRLRGS